MPDARRRPDATADEATVTPQQALLTPERAAQLDRLPSWLRSGVGWALERAPGRIGLRTLAMAGRVEIFDRAMTLAAQFFTSIFPLIIMLAAVIAPSDSQAIGEQLGLPPSAQEVLDASVAHPTFEAFGVVGVVLVLVSATSLSRALARMYAAVWALPRPRSAVRSAWRWVTPLVGFLISISLVEVLSRFTDDLSPKPVWTLALVVVVYGSALVLIPWLLLDGAVPMRWLCAGGLLGGVAMGLVNRGATLFLPGALVTSSDRYGPLGVAFTYIAYLYIVSWVIVATAVVGRALTIDESRVGRLLRGA